MKRASSRATALVRSSVAAQRPRISTCPQCSRIPPTSIITSTHSRIPLRRHQSSFGAAVAAAQNYFNNGSAASSPVGVDPLRSVAKELSFLTSNMRQLLGSGHPMLDTVAKYYSQGEGKYVRPTLVLLMSRATAVAPKSQQRSSHLSREAIDHSISPEAVLTDVNPDVPSPSSLTSPSTYSPEDTDIIPSQRRLAEITELIHTASLLHDDVIDHSVSRRSAPSANIAFGNKMAVLAGDFLLGRASVALARLRDPEVIELLATVIANLVEGEFMQLKNTARDEARPVWTEDTVTYYLQKTYLKSASLISKSCRAAALLGQNTAEVVEAAYQYGKNLGLAFQLIDDMLDYTVTESELGKPAGADLELGLATAPLLFAWRDNAELGALVGRKFSEEGDVRRARDLVTQSTGLEQTRALAQDYVDRAIHAISGFPESEAKQGLIEMCTKVMKRRK